MTLLNIFGEDPLDLATLFGDAPTFFVVLKAPRYEFAYANAAFHELMGARSLVGRTVRDAFPDFRAHDFTVPIEEVLATGEPFVARELGFRVARGDADEPEERFVDITYVPMRDAAGERRGVVLHGCDVTPHVAARRAAERLLQESERARAEAEAANLAKANFLATMSHELRTPLNAIAGYTEILELGIRGPVTEAQRHDLGRIQASRRHLTGIIEDVLNYARLDAGELEVARVPVQVPDTVEAALALVRPQALRKGIMIRYGARTDPHATYVGDESRVRQILVNLLANAVKYTGDGGHVELEWSRREAHDGTSRPCVAIDVCDNGTGIPEQESERIFDPFTQVDRGLTRSSGGSGLGLAICRGLARRMGGDVTLASTPGRGSRFTLWLPAADGGRDGASSSPAAGVGIARPPHHDASQAAAPHGDHRAGQPSGDERGTALARIGEALATDAVHVVGRWCERVRQQVPAAARVATPDIEDHLVTFVTEVALNVRLIGRQPDHLHTLVNDGTAIMTLLAERHGAQRARLGWTEASLAREFALLQEVLDETLQQLMQRHRGAEAIDEESPAADAIVAALVARGHRLSGAGFRLAAEAS